MKKRNWGEIAQLLRNICAYFYLHHRVRVEHIRAMIKAGIPLSKVDHFRGQLECYQRDICHDEPRYDYKDIVHLSDLPAWGSYLKMAERYERRGL